MDATKKTASYGIRVTEKGRKLVVTRHALAFRTGKPIPFLDDPS